MKTTNWYKTINKLNGTSLSCSVYSGGTANALLYSDKILVTYSASDSLDKLKINTPVGFEIVGAKVIGHSTASDTAFAIMNGSSKVVDYISASGDGIIRYANSIVKAQSEFNASDDDLYLSASRTGNAGASGTIVIDIVLEN